MSDPAAIAYRNRANAATGRAAEAAFCEECARRGARPTWRPGGQTIARANRDVLNFADAIIAWPEALWFVQARATAISPALSPAALAALRRLPDLAGVAYVLCWLTPDGEWRPRGLRPAGGTAALAWPGGGGA